MYKHFLTWLSKTKEADQIESANEIWNQIKQQIIEMFETTENDGIRTQCIKFMEVLIILQTQKDKWTIQENEFDLSELKQSNLINLDQLEEEAKQVFDNLVIFHGSPHISSVNLMATMQSLVLISRMRSNYFIAKVIQALETLHANLPPTLAKSQVSSVRKHLKLQLQILLKHPAAALNSTYQLQVIQLLNDLGASQSDVHKCLQEVRKRGLKIEQAYPEPKRIKLDNDSVTQNETVQNATTSTAAAANNNIIRQSNLTAVSSTAATAAKSAAADVKPIDSNLLKVTKTDACTAVDITAESLIPLLSNIENACDIVLLSLLSLPEQMPAHFQASYTPMGTAGTSSQIMHLARLLATQFTGAGIGKGVQEMVSKIENSLGNENIEDKQHHKISSLISRGIAQEIKKQEIIKNKALNKINLPTTNKTVSVTKAMKQLNFADITKEPTAEFRNQMIIESIKRILDEEDKIQFSSSQNEIRIQILSHLTIVYHRNIEVFNLIKDYAFNDLRNKLIILISIVNKQYEWYRKDADNFNEFNNCLISIITDFIYKTEPKDRDHYLPKFYAELSDLTDDSISLLKDYILLSKTSTIENGFNIAKVLIENIGSFRFKVLNLMLELCANANQEIRNIATKRIKQLHEESDEKFKQEIEKVSFEMLEKLLDTQSNVAMDEESIKLNLLPYLNLLPSNHKLIHSLATIYVSMNANIKRVILRSLESPVKGMGMSSPELLLLVENCPAGAETLVTRIIHVLTDKQSPSAELVNRVRDLYQKRVPDVRFLIPVLNGLSKKEVIDALPALIMLNPNVVKEVFNRLLNDNSNFQSPLTPSELLIALHNIDSNKCDMKTIIKATGLCFNEKNVYTSEVLAVVIQLLMEQNPLPTLLMRTVIQSVSLYPQLIGFVMNVLQRLILKQVWKEDKVWQGFIKCCQRTKPKSFQVLLQLPAPQLRTVFTSSPDFKIELRRYVESFDAAQRNLIPQSILDAIFKDNSQFNSSLETIVEASKNENSNEDTNSNQQNSDNLDSKEMKKERLEDSNREKDSNLNEDKMEAN